MSKYALVKDGTVENVILWDGVPYAPATDEAPATGWNPPDGYTALPLEDDSSVGPGWTYDGTTFTALPVVVPVLSPDEILTSNTATRDALLAQATSAIAPLQDAVDLDMATDAETALLKQWKQYRVAVNRVDLTQQNPTWPASPQW